MNGPKHFREAERLLAQGAREFVRPEGDPGYALAAAQVHATLALAAATAMQAAVDGCEPGMGSQEYHAWYEAAGVKPPQPAADPSPSLDSCTCGPDAVLPCGHCGNCDRCEDCGDCNGTGCTCTCEAQS